jgi:hypothetical protein
MRAVLRFSARKTMQGLPPNTDLSVKFHRDITHNAALVKAGLQECSCFINKKNAELRRSFFDSCMLLLPSDLVYDVKPEMNLMISIAHKFNDIAFKVLTNSVPCRSRHF